LVDARLPETLKPKIAPLTFTSVREATVATLTNRMSIGNTVASTLLFGGLFAFINSVQQIVADVFGRPSCWASCSPASRRDGAQLLHEFAVVERLGARRIAIAALASFTIVATVHLLLALTVGESLILFIVMQTLTMVSFGLVGANLGSLACSRWATSPAPPRRCRGRSARWRRVIGPRSARRSTAPSCRS
jgi:DHA1 family bicyclomycin/chloramphenicol resistance-like MFS transporter